MEKIIKGIQRFQKEVFPEQKEWFEHLAVKQQKPMALFITCADSRVNPNLITQTEPGDLFILRIAGNVIPPYGAARGGEEATIEYAVAVLGIKNIIVCGHSSCGAMRALMAGGNMDNLPAVKAWFSYAESTRQIMRHKYPNVTDPAQMEELAIRENVLVQLDHLRTHPSVAAGLARNQVQLHGWVYHIESGEILCYDGTSGQFRPVCAAGPSPVPAPAFLNLGNGQQAEKAHA